MRPETLIGIAAALIVVVIVLALLKRKRQPPSRIFKCGRCGNAAHHNERTSEAWRNGKSRFFCQACHRLWLQSQPQSARSHDHGGRSASGGCLGVVAAFTLLPLGGWLAWACL